MKHMEDGIDEVFCIPFQCEGCPFYQDDDCFLGLFEDIYDIAYEAASSERFMEYLKLSEVWPYIHNVLIKCEEVVFASQLPLNEEMKKDVWDRVTPVFRTIIVTSESGEKELCIRKSSELAKWIHSNSKILNVLDEAEFSVYADENGDIHIDWDQDNEE